MRGANTSVAGVSDAQILEWLKILKGRRGRCSSKMSASSSRLDCGPMNSVVYAQSSSFSILSNHSSLADRAAPRTKKMLGSTSKLIWRTI